PLSVDPRSLLVLDSFCGHLIDMIKNRFEEKNTNIVVILDGLTKKLQLLDVYINKSFKDENKDVVNLTQDNNNNNDSGLDESNKIRSKYNDKNRNNDNRNKNDNEDYNSLKMNKDDNSLNK
ncbi:14229_t:CDS:2, partial [Cetraspora pellucida]